MPVNTMCHTESLSFLTPQTILQILRNDSQNSVRTVPVGVMAQVSDL